MSSKSKIILALDSDNFLNIKKLLNTISKDIYGVKVGYQFFFNFNERGYEFLKRKKLKIFLDLKLHDIPNTVLNGIKALKKFKPDMITVHISGGLEMLNYAKKISKNIKVIGVSALTSLNNQNIKLIYNWTNSNKLVKEMINIALKSKIDGIVCSPKEITLVKKLSKNRLIVITPGIRPSTNLMKTDDQKRTMSPKEAIKLGANYIVIGRPILNSKNPKRLVRLINEQILWRKFNKYKNLWN